MIDKERNNKLFEDYKKKTYEELDMLEQSKSIAYNDYVILTIARGIKEIEDGMQGILAEDVFNELLGEDNKEHNIYATSENRFNNY